jgi:hypothetical protein
MDQLLDCADRLVASGIRAYTGLVSCGERDRSRRMLSDTMQISSLSSGGPSTVSALAPADGHGPGTAFAAVRCMVFFTLRSLLASLLALRATAYWTRVPALEELQLDCALLNRRLAESERDGGAPRLSAPAAG